MRASPQQLVHNRGVQHQVPQLACGTRRVCARAGHRPFQALSHTENAQTDAGCSRRDALTALSASILPLLLPSDAQAIQGLTAGRIPGAALSMPNCSTSSRALPFTDASPCCTTYAELEAAADAPLAAAASRHAAAHHMPGNSACHAITLASNRPPRSQRLSTAHLPRNYRRPVQHARRKRLFHVHPPGGQIRRSRRWLVRDPPLRLQSAGRLGRNAGFYCRPGRH